VLVDSDEHDEFGRITENLGFKKKIMVEKRLKKFKELEKDKISPELIGTREYEILIVGWGSTYHIIKRL